ncbi:hypothetical protein Xvie_00625 [Xenorhabdus vietnamensis]|uniref:Uncharacterized protein n=1 Tax=Xenorhabdus vietnamensis TaxID=351656 RepID=A0A1Y2SH39_9GAMM|nr:hypothetical protein Xvie_00625 [Xenorhabdus vietnamensis]
MLLRGTSRKILYIRIDTDIYTDITFILFIFQVAALLAMLQLEIYYLNPTGSSPSSLFSCEKLFNFKYRKIFGQIGIREYFLAFLQ